MQRSYTVVGMTCNHCIDRVTAGVSSVPGVQRAQARLEDGQLVVIGQDFTDTLSVAQLKTPVTRSRSRRAWPRKEQIRIDGSMNEYGMTVLLGTDPATARTRVEAALADQGFGVLSEIDVAATLKNKLNKDVPAQVILGACNPQLAHRALEAEESIGLLLPCNVVLRDAGDGRTIVSALDPTIMVTFTGNAALEPVASEARAKLAAALDALGSGAP